MAFKAKQSEDALVVRQYFVAQKHKSMLSRLFLLESYHQQAFDRHSRDLNTKRKAEALS